MSRRSLYIIISLATIALAISSCEKNDNDKNIINLKDFDPDYAELVEKYDTMYFSSCDEAIAAGNEIASVYYNTAQKAFEENDAKAKSDLWEFDELFNMYDSVINAMYSTCPEMFDKWEKDNRSKINSIKHKAYNCDKAIEDTMWTEDVSEEINAVNEQVEKLMIDIQKITEEEESIIN